MAKQTFRIFCILMMLIVVTQPNPVARRHAPEEDLSEEGEIDEDKRSGWNPEILDETDDNRSGEEPESFRPNSDELPELDDRGMNENEIGGKGDSDGFPGPFDGEEEFGGDGDPEETDESLDDERPTEEDDDGMEDIPGGGFDGGIGGQGKVPGPFGGGFFFDNPFFSFHQMRQYLNQLEKALEVVFRQTLEEASLLNGTYANTTEEEIDINGKKFIVQKSVIKGGNNQSAIYIETLSSKRKEEDEDTNGMEISKETKENVTVSH